MKTKMAIISLTFISMQYIATAYSAPIEKNEDYEERKEMFREGVDYLLKEGRHQLNFFCDLGKKYNNVENKSYWDPNNIEERKKTYSKITKNPSQIEGILGAQAFAMSKVCPQVW